MHFNYYLFHSLCNSAIVNNYHIQSVNFSLQFQFGNISVNL